MRVWRFLLVAMMVVVVGTAPAPDVRAANDYNPPVLQPNPQPEPRANAPSTLPPPVTQPNPQPEPRANAPQGPAQNGSTLYATFNPVVVSPLIGTTGIVWNTGAGYGEIWVSENGTAERLFAGGVGGTQAATWVAAGRTFVFTLYRGTAHSETLNTYTVTVAVALTANPTTVAVGSGLGTTTIIWSVGSAPGGEVWMSMDGTAERLFAGGAAGSQDAPWIQTGHSYAFRLYPGTTHTGTPLLTVTVTR